MAGLGLEAEEIAFAILEFRRVDPNQSVVFTRDTHSGDSILKEAVRKYFAISTRRPGRTIFFRDRHVDLIKLKSKSGTKLD